MDINQIENRLKEIEGQLQQTLATYNALIGAKNELLVWKVKLEEIQKENHKEIDSK